jgi:glycosyltransferase involved in cell wall biosynthesis
MSALQGADLVSVCIPAYNNARFISETIASVLAQSYENLEVVVVDDHSSDQTFEIASAFSDPRLSVSRNAVNLGPAGNWNEAVGRANGTFVKVLCGDDLLYPACIERQVQAFEVGGPEVSIVACQRDILDDEGCILFRGFGARGVQGRLPSARALKWIVRSGTTPIGEPAAVLMRAESLKRTAGFRAETKSMLDVDMWVQLVRLGDLIVEADSLAAFRVQDRSWSHAVARVKAAEVRALWNGLRRSYPDEIPWLTVQIGLARSELRTRAKRAFYVMLAVRRRCR